MSGDSAELHPACLPTRTQVVFAVVGVCLAALQIPGFVCAKPDRQTDRQTDRLLSHATTATAATTTTTTATTTTTVYLLHEPVITLDGVVGAPRVLANAVEFLLRADYLYLAHHCESSGDDAKCPSVHR